MNRYSAILKIHIFQIITFRKYRTIGHIRIVIHLGRGNVRDCFRQCNLRESIAIVECAGPQRYQIRRQHNVGQYGTSAECCWLNSNNRIWNIHCRQTLTILKCRSSDTGQTLRQGQIPQIGTALKRAVSNGQDIILHDHSFQTFVILKCAFTNGSDIVAVQLQGDGQRCGVSIVASDSSITVFIQSICIDNYRFAGGAIAGGAAVTQTRTGIARIGAGGIATVADLTGITGSCTIQILSGATGNLLTILIVDADLYRTVLFLNHLVGPAETVRVAEHTPLHFRAQLCV